jgi:hypothetical protein
MTRTVSGGCNEMANSEYRTKLVRELEAEAAERAKKEKEVCGKCLKSRLAKQPSSWVTIPVELREQLDGAAQVYKGLCNSLDEMCKGRVARYKDYEWVVSYASHEDAEIRVHMYRVNKTKPWLQTDVQDWVRLDKVEITTKMFAERENAVEAA